MSAGSEARAVDRGSRSASAQGQGDGEIGPAEVRALLDLVAGTDVEELEVEHRGVRVLIRRQPTPPRPAAPPRDPEQRVQPSAAGASAAEGGAPEHLVVTSGWVGLFFRGHEPGAEPLAREGDQVSAGQSLAIVESLRVPHAVESELAGVLERVLVEDGHPVEYGQPLLLVRPES
jgi:acetyl-CoA carboxylase biotin carboxyl carrier protein